MKAQWRPIFLAHLWPIRRHYGSNLVSFQIMSAKKLGCAVLKATAFRFFRSPPGPPVLKCEGGRPNPPGWAGSAGCVRQSRWVLNWAVASRRNTGRILTERYRGFRATCNSPFPAPPGLASRCFTCRSPVARGSARSAIL